LLFTCCFYDLCFNSKFSVLANVGGVKMKALDYENEMLLGYKIKRMKGYWAEV